MTVLGGCAAWPAAGQACGGYVLEHGGFRLLLDPGYATLPRLLERISARDVDAVLLSHGHPDHCADLHPLLRARALGDEPSPALPVYAPPGAADRVLDLEGPESMRDAYVLSSFDAGGTFEIGPFRVDSRPLPHFVPNAGLRLTAGGGVLAYTGDTGPSPEIATLARGADVLLAEATFPDEMPARFAGYLSTARQAGGYAARAGAGRLVLTHLWPGTEREHAEDAARREYGGDVGIAHGGIAVDLG